MSRKITFHLSCSTISSSLYFLDVSIPPRSYLRPSLFDFPLTSAPLVVSTLRSLLITSEYTPAALVPSSSAGWTFHRLYSSLHYVLRAPWIHMHKTQITFFSLTSQIKLMKPSSLSQFINLHHPWCSLPASPTRPIKLPLLLILLPGPHVPMTFTLWCSSPPVNYSNNLLIKLLTSKSCLPHSLLHHHKQMYQSHP